MEPLPLNDGKIELKVRDALMVGGGEGCALPVTEGEAPAERVAVGENEAAGVAEEVNEGVWKAAPVPLDGGAGVQVEEGVDNCMALLEGEVLAVMLGLAPHVSEAVGEADCVELAESVEVGVAAAVPVPVPVAEGVGEGVGVDVGVALLESEVLAVMLGDTPELREAVGEADTVKLPLSVEVGVSAAVPLPLSLGVPVPVATSAVALPLSKALVLMLGLKPAVKMEDCINAEGASAVLGVPEGVPELVCEGKSAQDTVQLGMLLQLTALWLM